MDSSEICAWLNDRLAELRLVSYPFELTTLPANGIYFFYEKGEFSGHGAGLQRIVRIGTHRDGNFRSRISEHYLLDDRKMLFGCNQPRPHDRSIFRKNIGRAILNKSKDPYLTVWNIDFMKTANTKAYRHLRDVEKERQIEMEVSRVLRETFSFRFLSVDDEQQRIGPRGLEQQMIGTVAQCTICGPSEGWLGNHSPVPKIRSKGLWQEQHISAPPLSRDGRSFIEAAVRLARR